MRLPCPNVADYTVYRLYNSLCTDYKAQPCKPKYNHLPYILLTNQRLPKAMGVTEIIQFIIPLSSYRKEP
jgi:hypothetical protein